MHAAEKLGPMISQPLTWAQICERYPDEWVCLVEVEHEHPNGGEVVKARVVGHGKSRKEPFVQARPWREHYELITHYFTGRLTELPRRPPLVLDDQTRDALRH